jgi:hypothetical protein
MKKKKSDNEAPIYRVLIHPLKDDTHAVITHVKTPKGKRASIEVDTRKKHQLITISKEIIPVPGNDQIPNKCCGLDTLALAKTPKLQLSIREGNAVTEEEDQQNLVKLTSSAFIKLTGRKYKYPPKKKSPKLEDPVWVMPPTLNGAANIYAYAIVDDTLPEDERLVYGGRDIEGSTDIVYLNAIPDTDNPSRYYEDMSFETSEGMVELEVRMARGGEVKGHVKANYSIINPPPLSLNILPTPHREIFRVYVSDSRIKGEEILTLVKTKHLDEMDEMHFEVRKNNMGPIGHYTIDFRRGSKAKEMEVFVKRGSDTSKITKGYPLLKQGLRSRGLAPMLNIRTTSDPETFDVTVTDTSVGMDEALVYQGRSNNGSLDEIHFEIIRTTAGPVSSVFMRMKRTPGAKELQANVKRGTVKASVKQNYSDKKKKPRTGKVK